MPDASKRYTPPKDAPPRPLTAPEVAALALDVQTRCNNLTAQGVPLPTDQMEHHLIIGLLEELLGPDRSLKVKEWHLSWVDNQLDKVEASLRMGALAGMEGALHANGGIPRSPGGRLVQGLPEP